MPILGDKFVSVQVFFASRLRGKHIGLCINQGQPVEMVCSLGSFSSNTNRATIQYSTGLQNLLFYFRKLRMCFKYNRSQIQYLHSLSYHSLLFIDHKRPLRDVGQEHKGTYYREINDVFVNVLHTRSTKEPTPRPSSSSYSINRKTSF